MMRAVEPITGTDLNRAVACCRAMQGVVLCSTLLKGNRSERLRDTQAAIDGNSIKICEDQSHIRVFSTKAL